MALLMDIPSNSVVSRSLPSESVPRSFAVNHWVFKRLLESIPWTFVDLPGSLYCTCHPYLSFGNSVCQPMCSHSPKSKISDFYSVNDIL